MSVDRTSITPLGATPPSRSPVIIPAWYHSGCLQQYPYHYVPPPYYMVPGGQLYNEPLVSNPEGYAPTQTHWSRAGLSGYIPVPVETVPTHSSIFEGGYAPLTALEESATTASLSLHATYEGHQPFIPSSEILSTGGFLQYNQASSTRQSEAVLGNLYGSTSQFIPYLANQAQGSTPSTLVPSSAQPEPSPSAGSLGLYSSLSSVYDDSTDGYSTDLSPYSQDRGPLEPNGHSRGVDRAPLVVGSIPSVPLDLPELPNPSLSRPRRRPTQCQPNLAHAPQHLRRGLELLLSLLQSSEFFRNHELEPTVDQAKALLLIVKNQTGILLGKDARGSDSIYTLFADRESKEVWLCGDTQGNPSRAVGHIRSIVNHRPFPCLGRSGGCARRRCARAGMTVSFFTKALRDEHMKRSARKEQCPREGCGKCILKAGMLRHLKTHNSTPTPSH